MSASGSLVFRCGRQLDVNAALELLSLPAAGSGIRGIERQRCARLASNARIADLIERQERNGVPGRIVPDLLRRPASQRADLADDLAARQRKRLDFFELRSRRRLLTA